MKAGTPSVTAKRVAGHRLTFDRLDAAFGDPAPDERLALDVAGSVDARHESPMVRYLAARTSFFDRILVAALTRGVGQVVIAGAGYDGRAFRYAKPGVRWDELDHPDTQGDKQARLIGLDIETLHVKFIPTDFGTDQFVPALLATGFDPHARSAILCEGVAVYLDQTVVESVLRQLRSVAGVGTELAISLSVASESPDNTTQRARFLASVAAVGETARSSLTGNDMKKLFDATGWRPFSGHSNGVESQRDERAGFVIAEPLGDGNSGQSDIRCSLGYPAT